MILTHREKVKIKNMLHFLKIRFLGLNAASLNNNKIIASLILKIYLVEIFEQLSFNSFQSIEKWIILTIT